MTNITVNVVGAQAVAALDGPLTCGMVGVPVTYTFDEIWEGLSKTAVFQTSGLSIAVPMETDEITVPWEVLKKGCTLLVGVYGLSETGDIAIPTVWAQVGQVQPGADPEATPGADPTLPIWKQAMDTAQSVRDDADMGLFDGYSPVRGVDYWTEADKNEIRSYVDDAILGGVW